MMTSSTWDKFTINLKVLSERGLSTAAQTLQEMSKWVTPHQTVDAGSDVFRLPSSRPQETLAPFSPVPVPGRLKHRSQKLKENKIRAKRSSTRHSGSKPFSTLPLSGKEAISTVDGLYNDEESMMRIRDFNGASRTTLRATSTAATSPSLASPFASRAPSPKNEPVLLERRNSNREANTYGGSTNHNAGLQSSPFEPLGLRRMPSAPVPLRPAYELERQVYQGLPSSSAFGADFLAQCSLRIENSGWLPASGLGAVNFNRPPSRLSFFEELGFGWSNKEVLDTKRLGSERPNWESPDHSFSSEGFAAVATPPQVHSLPDGDDGHPSKRKSLSAFEGLDLNAAERHVGSKSKSEGDDSDVDMDLTSDIVPITGVLCHLPHTPTTSPDARSSSESFSAWLDAPFTTWETDSLISPPTIYQKLTKVGPNRNSRSVPNGASKSSHASKESDNSLDWPSSRSSSDSDDVADPQRNYPKAARISSVALRTRSGTIIGPQIPDPPGTRRTRSGTITIQSSIPASGMMPTGMKRGRSGTIVPASTKVITEGDSPPPQLEPADSFSDLGDDEKEEGFQDSIYFPPSSDSPDEMDFLIHLDPFGWGDESGDEEFIDGSSDHRLSWCVPLDPPSPTITRVKAPMINQRAIHQRDKALLNMRALGGPRKRGRGCKMASVPSIREHDDDTEEDELNCFGDDANPCIF